MQSVVRMLGQRTPMVTHRFLVHHQEKQSTALPQMASALAMLVLPVFFKHSCHAPTSGPLHRLFPLPRIFSPYISAWLAFSLPLNLCTNVSFSTRLSLVTVLEVSVTPSCCSSFLHFVSSLFTLDILYYLTCLSVSLIECKGIFFLFHSLQYHHQSAPAYKILIAQCLAHSRCSKHIC